MVQVLLNVIINANMKTKRIPRRAPKACTAAIVRLVQRAGILRLRDLAREGVPRIYLQRMVGVACSSNMSAAFTAFGRGGNGAPQPRPSRQAHLTWSHLPTFRASLLRLTTQTPFEVWIALEPGARSPRIYEPKVLVVRFSGAAMKTGMEVKSIEGVSVRTTASKDRGRLFQIKPAIGIEIPTGPALWFSPEPLTTSTTSLQLKKRVHDP
jgi:hypothetical protein